jgi:DNA-binding MarR family transcriptional regulator
VLTVLQRRDGLTVTELAHNSFVKVQSMADLLRPLYARERIHRRAGPAHGRRQLISLTPDEEAVLLRRPAPRCRTALVDRRF